MSLNLKNITIGKNEQKLIANFSLEIANGEIISIMAPSGRGKSSLLNFIAGFLDPVFSRSGQIFLHNKELTSTPPENRKIGMLFQDNLLFPHLSVAGNLAFAIPACYSRAQRKSKIDNCLKIIGMPDSGSKDPARLSGGQKSRVALMQALLAEPQAMLLDEPFAGLDHKLRNEMMNFTFEHLKAVNIPCLLVTHDQATADSTQRIIHL